MYSSKKIPAPFLHQPQKQSAAPAESPKQSPPPIAAAQGLPTPLLAFFLYDILQQKEK